jgi:hypothetical protein
MNLITLTQLRQNLFELADRVIDSGEALVIERRGVRLRLSRESVTSSAGRLARLKPQSVVLGKSLRPDESPAIWSALNATAEGTHSFMAEKVALEWPAPKPRKPIALNKRKSGKP